MYSAYYDYIGSTFTVLSIVFSQQQNDTITTKVKFV